MKPHAATNGHTQPHANELAKSRPPTHDVVVVGPAPVVVRVVLTDSQPAIRHGIRSLLARSGRVAVVGEASTAAEALAAAARYQPDVLVIDLSSADAAEIQVVRQIREVSPETGILVFSAVEDGKTITSALRAGARGYLIKSAGPDEIVRCIQAVAAGEVIVGRTIANRFAELMREAATQDSYPFPQLTSRERDVLELIATGRSNLVIARELAFAPKTISNRVSVIFSKLGVADRSEAIVLARDAGLGHG
jgi:DNA-binding NarL/FixJ family response regulator